MRKLITASALSLSLLSAASLSANNGKLHGAPNVFRLNPNFVENVNYVKGKIIFKVKAQYRANCSVSYINNPALNAMMNTLGVSSLAKIYPNHKQPEVKYNKLGQAYEDLSLIYELTFQNNVQMEKAVNLMISTGMVEYAQPRFINKVSAFLPNDPNASASGKPQYNYLNRIKAYNAWDLTAGGTQGDTNVVIGIVDSGTDLAHPDLQANFKHNYADPINGVDDDGDGYKDNFTGWDLAGADYNNIVGDNTPQIQGTNNEHGSHVSGCASAVTNNSVGVAGIGFKCKLLPVKCAADNDTRGTGGEGYIITGYEGITYAADHGAKVINCSWGGTGASSYEQSIINYAAVNKGALVVAAAGNDGADEMSYPAALNYVLSVAATNANNDGKASFSNWNYTVDISTPGNQIYNTVYSQTYTYMSGTSMASPITSGGAALVLSKYPTYTGMQAGQRLIATTDNHYASNTPYKNKLGSGRLNLFTAVTSTVASQGESVVFTNDSVTDHGDLVYTQGDTLFISGLFINYLNATTSSATAVLTPTTNATAVTAINTTYNLGAMATLTSKNNTASPFKFKVNATGLNTTVTFMLTITDGAYTQKYFFDVLLNPDYVNITINQVHTTITSRGKIGYSKDAQAGGLGFNYNGTSMLYESGLMVGTSTTAVSDCIRGTSTTGASDTDFVTVVTAHKVTPPQVSDFDVNGTFNDNNASPVQKLLVKQNSYAWSSAGSSKFVIVEYVIKNNGTSTLNNLRAGIFADWDIDASTYASNKSAYDASRKLGYTYATPANGKYAGIRVVSNNAANFYAIDNQGIGHGGVNLTSTFSKADKYITLSTQRLTAGDSTAQGNDVCNVMSCGPFTLVAGDSTKIAFALLAGDDLTDLQTSADTALVRYNGQTTAIHNTNSFSNFAVYPNPASNSLSFIFSSAENENCSISLYNNLGQAVKTIFVNIAAQTLHNATIDISELAAGAYTYKVSGANGKTNVGKVIVTK